jgi:hypothetical protein
VGRANHAVLLVRELDQRLLIAADMKLALALATVLATGCAGDESSLAQSATRLPGECGELEGHVFGVFDDGSNGDEPIDETIVTLQRPGRHFVVLSGHDSVKWKVVAENGAEIEKVYTMGGAKQLVTVPRGTEVINATMADGGTFACGYSWPPTGDCDTSVLLKLTSLMTQHHPTTFHGCKSARFFTVGEDLTTSTDCDNASELKGARQVDLVTSCSTNEDDEDPNNDCDDATQYY